MIVRDYDALRRVDEAVDIYDVADRYGLGWGENTGKASQVHCPMHNDSTPSARVYPDSNSGYCWTCQKSFGPIALTASQEGIGWSAAAEMLARRHGVDITPGSDLGEFHRLLNIWEDGAPVTPEQLADLRRVVSMQYRATELTWPQTQALITAYDVLDGTTIAPTDWLSFALEAVVRASAGASDGVG